MTAQKGKISAFQLYSVFFVSLISSVFTSLNSEAPSYNAAAKILNFIPFLAWGTLAAVPLFLTAGKKGDQTLLSRCARLSPTLAKATAVLYSAAALWCAGLGLARLGFFVSAELFQDRNVTLLLLLLTAAAGYAASRELETLGRTAVVFSALLLFSVLLIVGASLKLFDAAELPPISDATPGTLASGGFLTITKSAEITSLLLLAPEVSGRLRKGYFCWLAVFGAVAALIFTVTAGVTGAFGARQEFQFYALTSVAKLGQMERLDELLSALWILCVFAKTTFFLLLAQKATCYTFCKANKNLILLLFYAVLSALCVLLSASESLYRAAASVMINGPVFLLLIFGIPLAVFFASALRKRKKADAK